MLHEALVVAMKPYQAHCAPAAPCALDMASVYNAAHCMHREKRIPLCKEMPATFDLTVEVKGQLPT